MVDFFHRIPASNLVDSRAELLIKLVDGKSVLHVGCVDSGLTASRVEKGALLHGQLAKKATRLCGIDVDEAGIKLLRGYGFENLYAVAPDQNSPTTERFDVVLAGEVLEHVSNPGEFLTKYTNNIGDKGKLILTVPNAFCFTTIFRLFSGIETVHEDHVAYYSFSTLKRLFSRYDLQIDQLFFYSEIDRLTGWKRVLKNIFHKVLRLFPQFGEGLVVVASKSR
ncbi:class I SAM-dependent methyltransferase [Polaromonas jejuensis]|uniref:Class I SAM-dependent methyltransferase n=1 Tax=Polaromonas jejuensis TaxID=457502 RepID=A0ABW0Q690_9BURK|nr:methyltransferase domain-containing protein [Polaromonas jejuensis]